MERVRRQDAVVLGLVDDNWSGDAAEQYRQKIGSQKAAMESIRSEFATTIAMAPDTVRNGIIVFWVAVATALIALIAGIAGAAVLTALGALGGGLAILTSTVESANGRMTQAATFGSDTWPTFALS